MVTGVVGLGQNITKWRRRYQLKTIPEGNPCLEEIKVTPPVPPNSANGSVMTNGGGGGGISVPSTAASSCMEPCCAHGKASPFKLDDGASDESESTPVEEQILHELEGSVEDDVDESWSEVERRFQDATGMTLDPATS